MRAAKQYGVALGLCSGLIAASPLMAAWAQDNAAVSQLVQQAQFWDAKQRPDLALESWKRVLQADPNNAQALARLAEIENQNGNRGEAQRYLDTLRRVAPDSSATQRAQQQLSGATNAATISRARQLAQQGRAADAIGVYDQVFGGHQPPDDLTALEYYETMAGIESRYGEARDALAKLAQRNPDDPRYALTYARVLTYRANTRRDGIAKLREMAGDPKYGLDARKAWRQALIWLQATPADQALYQAYLDNAGNDPQVAEKLDALKNAKAGAVAAQASEAEGAELARAFRNLNAGELDAAESSFERLVGKGGSSAADARAGLGLIRLRQQRFKDATSLFDTAIRAKPSLEPRYREARRTALFWSRAHDAQRASDAGNTRSAEALYAQAVASPPPGGVPSAITRAYADTLVANNQSKLAEQQLRTGLRAHPNDPQLVSGLAALLYKGGRSDEASKLLATAPEASRAEFRTTQAELARQQAEALMAAGRNAEAEQKLREALTAAPESPWIRLDLARLYRRTGRDDDAEQLLNSMTEAAGNSAQAHLAQAYAFTEQQRWYDALMALEGLPTADRTPDARKLQREAWVRYQVQRSTQAAKQGDASHAAEWLGDAVTAAGDDPSLASALAQGWAALGDPARAVAVLRRSFAKRGEPDPGDRIQYAALLLQLDQDAEFEAVSTTLIQKGDMSPQQSKTLEDLIVGYRIKLADRAREEGNFGAAYKQLREVVARYPDQPRVQMALARLFASAGEPDKALAIARSLMSQPQPTDEQLYASIDAALAAGDKDTAAQWIDVAFNRKTDLVAAHRAAGRLAELRGRQAEALAHYREADALAKQQRDYTAAPPELMLIDPATGGAKSLPGPMQDLLQGTDVPIGPLLPRAPDAGTEAPLPAPVRRPISAQDARYGGYHLDAQLGAAGSTTGTSGSATSGTPVALQMDRRMHTPVADSQWTPPFDASQVKPMDRLEGEVSGWMLGGFNSRTRDGEAGLGKLFDLETPIDWVSREFRGGRIGIRLRPAYLDAGTVSGTTTLMKYGTLALINGESDNLDQTDSGLAVGAAYQIGDFVADLGTTPLGFRVESLVGGLQWSPSFGAWSLTLDLSRRAVTDSLLSYAGAYDPLTGRDWGGVVRSGARADIAYDFGRYGLYGNGGYYALTGRNVDENTQFELGGGLFVRAYQRGTQTLTVGVNLTSFGYDKNLRYYSFGHGGYFSPQFFSALTIPASFTGSVGSLSYRLDAAMGIQSFREDGTALYPNNGALQDEVEELADYEASSDIPTGYASQKNTGLGYRFGGAAQYRLTDNFQLGGTLSVDNARDYQEINLIGYLRYYFGGVQMVPTEPQIPSIFKGPLP
ncbi:cellulose biosynthesis protein BcsC [Solimonas marina]|uniref:Tetratricopeptide repeat protein n=1 Tax=Solimonas marina TaxID=2714601 RepID=A0A969WBX6_9GAMM|nr:cellulose biosynthesis protein BcsC [Solimonas marina]NKF23728.1 tetratricopeptide repeat protein [Solimonas marina]